MNKILTILRHGKAEKGLASDEARPLTARGVEESREMGRYFAAQKLAFGRVICSPSTRTRQTLDGLQELYRAPMAVDYERKLYLASANEMLKLIAAADESAQSILLIGHNPGLHELAVKLSQSGDQLLLRHMSAEFPPCSFAAIDLGEIKWPMVPTAKGKLLTFVTPKTLE